MFLPKKKGSFGKKRKWAFQKAVDWHVEHDGLTVEEAELVVKDKRIKKNKKRKALKGQRFK